MKKSVKLICLILAVLMIATTVVGALASIAYGEEGDFASASSSMTTVAEQRATAEGNTTAPGDKDKEDTDVIVSGGKLKWETYPAFYYRGGNSSTTRLNKNRAYRVVVDIVDNSVDINDMKLFSDYPNDSYKNTAIPWDKYFTAYVESSGGNFMVVPRANYDKDSDEDYSGVDLDCTMRVVGVTSSNHPIYQFSFYVEPDGAGKVMSLNIEYEYEKRNTSSNPTSPWVWESRSGALSRTIPEVYINDNSSSTSGSESSEDESYLIGKPNIIITSYSYGNGQIVAGSNFPLTLEFKNTSPELDLENVIVNVTTSTDLAISSGSNSKFIDFLDAEKSANHTFQVSTTIAAKPEPQQVTVKFTYEYILNKKRETGERTEVIAIPIVQPDRFTIGNLVVPTQIFPGESAYLTLDYVNKGKGEISNLSARLETNVPGVGENQNIGNVAAGASGTIDFTTTFNDSGVVEGTVFVTYEDAKGEEKITELPFTATVMDMGGMGGEEPPIDFPVGPVEPEGLSFPAKVMACAGGLMVAGLVFTVVVKKAKAKRDEASDEDI